MRCEICKTKTPKPSCFKGRILCDGCYCEYRAVFEGKVNAKRTRKAKEKEVLQEIPKTILEIDMFGEKNNGK